MHIKPLLFLGLASFLIYGSVTVHPVGTSDQSKRSDTTTDSASTVNGLQPVDQNWRILPQAPSATRLFSHGSYLFAGSNSELSGQGSLFRSINDGQTWERVDAGMLVGISVQAFASIGATLIVGTSNGICRSDNQGQLWTQVNTGLNDPTAQPPKAYYVRNMASVGTTLFAATALLIGGQSISAKLFRSTDQGQNWIDVTSALPTPITDIATLAVSGANIYAGTNKGILRSTDNGQTWTLANFESKTVVAAGAYIYSFDSASIWRSNDHGEHWTKITAYHTEAYSISLGANGSYIFYISYHFLPSARFPYSVFHYSPNYGQTWFGGGTPLHGPPSIPQYYYFFSYNYAAGERLYLSERDSIYYSDGFRIPGLATVSAASYFPGAAAAESIVAAFGTNLTTATESAVTFALPTILADTTVKVKDSMGVERLAPLFFVSPGQINYQIPPGSASGPATTIVTSNNVEVAYGEVHIEQIVPSIFSANANGKDVASALVVRVKPDGSQRYESAVAFDTVQNKYVTAPIDLGPETDTVFLTLFVNGIRNLSNMDGLKLKIGGVEARITYAGPQLQYAGLDQINAIIPRILAGSGEVDVDLVVDGKSANKVRVNIR